MTRAIVIHENGVVDHVDIKTDLDTLQGIVGGWLECVTFNEHVHLYCDEEGKLKDSLLNPVATRFATAMIPRWDDLIMGPVIVLGSTPDGEEDHVPAEIVDYFKR